MGRGRIAPFCEVDRRPGPRAELRSSQEAGVNPKVRLSLDTRQTESIGAGRWIVMST
jgi:hypothetical protein